MAQKVQIVLEDDIDGSEATQTISFALDGSNYEIDLNDQNAEALRGALAPYVGHARKTTASRRGGASRKSSNNTGKTDTGGASSREIRDWARSNGYKVPDRGRIPSEVREAFEAAH